MIHTTAIITPETILARCTTDNDGCLLWSGSTIQGKPYWATYDENGKRVNVNVARSIAEGSGHSIRRGAPIKRKCGKFLCLNIECMHLPVRLGMFSQLVAAKSRNQSLSIKGKS